MKSNNFHLHDHNASGTTKNHATSPLRMWRSEKLLALNMYVHPSQERRRQTVDKDNQHARSITTIAMLVFVRFKSLDDEILGRTATLAPPTTHCHGVTRIMILVYRSEEEEDDYPSTSYMIISRRKTDPNNVAFCSGVAFLGKRIV